MAPVQMQRLYFKTIYYLITLLDYVFLASVPNHTFHNERGCTNFCTICFFAVVLSGTLQAVKECGLSDETYQLSTHPLFISKFLVHYELAYSDFDELD